MTPTVTASSAAVTVHLLAVVEPVNDAPELSCSSSSLTVSLPQEAGQTTFSDSLQRLLGLAAPISVLEHDPYDELTVEMRATGGAQLAFLRTPPRAITVHTTETDSETASTLQFSGPVIAVNYALAMIRYSAPSAVTAAAAGVEMGSVSLAVRDRGELADSCAWVVTGLAGSEQPPQLLGLPASLSVWGQEDEPLPLLPALQVQLSRPLPGAVVRVTLAVSAGSFSYTPTESLYTATSHASSTYSSTGRPQQANIRSVPDDITPETRLQKLVLFGTLDVVNEYLLNALTYYPEPDTNTHSLSAGGLPVLSVTTDEYNFQTGASLSEQVLREVQLYLQPVNDPAVILSSAPSSLLLVTPEDVPVLLGDEDEEGQTALHLSIQDVDAHETRAPIEVFLTVSAGMLRMPEPPAGVLLLDDQQATLHLLGQLSAVNAALSTLQYVPAADFHGEDALVVDVFDSVAASEQLVLRLQITPVNDPPVISAPSRVVTQEDTAVRLTDIVVSDVDFLNDVHDAEVMTLTLSVSASQSNDAAGHVWYPQPGSVEAAAATGTLTMSGTQVKWGEGAADVPASVLVVTGPPAGLQKALLTLSYTPPQDFSGVNVLSLSLSDLGYYSGTGVGAGQERGAALVAGKQVALLVLAVDDPAEVTTTTTALLALAHDPTSLVDHVTLSDPDADNGQYELAMTCRYCDWEVLQPAMYQQGIFASTGHTASTDTDTAQLTLRGGFMRLQTALQFVRYTSHSAVSVTDEVIFQLQRESSHSDGDGGDEVTAVSVVDASLLLVSTATLRVEVTGNTLPPSLAGRRVLQLPEDGVATLFPSSPPAGLLFAFDPALTASACSAQVLFDPQALRLTLSEEEQGKGRVDVERGVPQRPVV